MLARSVTNPLGTSIFGTGSRVSAEGFQTIGSSKIYIGSLNRRRRRAPLTSFPPFIHALIHCSEVISSAVESAATQQGISETQKADQAASDKSPLRRDMVVINLSQFVPNNRHRTARS